MGLIPSTSSAWRVSLERQGFVVEKRGFVRTADVRFWSKEWRAGMICWAQRIRMASGYDTSARIWSTPGRQAIIRNPLTYTPTHLVLTPFDTVQCHSFLYQFPQRTELPQKADPLRHGVQDVVDLALGGKSTNAEANAAVSALVAVPECSENVTGLEGGRGARAAGGKSNVFQSHEERFSLHVGE